jgi:hypothetical protein
MHTALLRRLALVSFVFFGGVEMTGCTDIVTNPAAGIAVTGVSAALGGCIAFDCLGTAGGGSKVSGAAKTSSDVYRAWHGVNDVHEMAIADQLTGDDIAAAMPAYHQSVLNPGQPQAWSSTASGHKGIIMSNSNGFENGAPCYKFKEQITINAATTHAGGKVCVPTGGKESQISQIQKVRVSGSD